MKADEVENFRKLMRVAAGSSVTAHRTAYKRSKGYSCSEDLALDQAGYPSAAIPGAETRGEAASGQ